MRIRVITVSDRAASGEYVDRSGDQVERLLRNSFPEAEITRGVVEADADAIREALVEAEGVDYVFTTGGTGIAPQDVTPEVSRAFCDKELPGVAEALRFRSLEETPYAVFSRAYAGIKNKTILVNLPGAVDGALFCVKLMVPVMEHGIDLLRGHGHDEQAVEKESEEG